MNRAPGDAVLPARTNLTVTAGAFFLILFGYMILAFQLGNAPLQDLPNHLARAHIMGDLLFNHGANYGRLFEIVPSFSPYLFGDLILASLDSLVGIEWAARLWIAASFLLLPLSVASFLRAYGVAREVTYVGAILALYLVSGWLFATGLIDFQLGLACVFFACASLKKYLTTGQLRSLFGFLLFVTIGYLFHLSALVFICFLMGVYFVLAVFRKSQSARTILLLSAWPALLLLIHYVIASRHPVVGPWPTYWGGVASKLSRIALPGYRFSVPLDMPIFACFVAACVVGLFFNGRRIGDESMGLLLTAAACLGLYAAMPSSTGHIYYVDLRALPLSFVFLMSAGLIAGAHSKKCSRLQFVLAVVMATANLALLLLEMVPLNAAMGRYKEIASLVPAGAHVLPIDTRTQIVHFRPFLHAGSYATIYAGAVTPYLFSADQDAGMPYFKYFHRDNAPSAYWYGSLTLADSRKAEAGGPIPGPTLEEIRRQFAYLLITVPWDPSKISEHVSVVAKNDIAALLKVEP